MKAAILVATVLVIADIWVLVTDRRILIWKTIVRPGPTFVVEDHGDLDKNRSPSLVCRYFNGRKILTIAFWYASNNIMGRDSCPFLRGAND